MAKDSAQSRIPRLDGITRIPIPGAMRSIVSNQKSHIAMAPPKAIATQQRPSSYSGVGQLRTPVAALASLKKSSSGDKISEAVKRTSNIMKKFWTKPTAPACNLNDNKTADNTIILDKEAKEDVNQKLLTRSDSGQPRDQQTHNETRTLTRSETFVRDSNNDEDSTMLSLAHNIIPADEHLKQVSNYSCAKSKDALFITRTIDMNATTVAETTMTIDPYVKQKEALNDDTITLPENATREIQQYSPAWSNNTLRKCADLSADDTIIVAPDKSNMKLVLNSTMNCERLLDVSAAISPARSLMNLTRELNESPLNDKQQLNNTKLLYMTIQEDMDQTLVAEEEGNLELNQEDQRDHEELRLEDESMEVDDELPENVAQILNANQIQEIKAGKPRFSFGMDLTEYTLDCSIELCDVSIGSSIPAQSGSPVFKKQNSFEMDESLGILTPDQMKEFLDSATTNTNLDLPINAHNNSKLAIHQMRIDQTPSPEDLPLDPVGVKTDLTDVIMSQPMTTGQHSIQYNQQEISQTDSYSKTDQMSKSNASKVSNSFITSITSITSLDTGYQGDGEMSRPASRGAGDHSPSNGPRKPHLGRQPSFNQNGPANIPIRRQDPMTDSDFFTESDADDIFHRGDRRAQVIDGQLYGPMLQPANVFITEQPQMEDSCMESSGIFTDVENRCDDDLAQSRGDPVVDVDMSPDGSTDTVKSNNTEYNSSSQHQQQPPRSSSAMSQGHSNVLTDSQTSSTIQSSTSSERISISSISGIGRCGGMYAQSGAVKSSLCNVEDGENLKKTSSVVTDDKKSSPNGLNTSAKKLQQNSSLSVKKSISSCKQRNNHQYGTGGERDYNVSATISREGGKHEIKSSAKKSAVLSSSPASHATRLKSRSSLTSENDYHPGNGAEMLVKNGSTATSPRLRDPANQENRRPPNGSRAGSAASDDADDKFSENLDVIGGGDRHSVQLQHQQQGNSNISRKASPNKWEAVMNKIAENKSTKKNYSQVKSKVVSGMLLRRNGGTPRLTKSPANQSQDSNCGSVNSSNATSGLSSPQSKGALKQSATKRGRSFSKDSQQSSQSDLSLSGGSSTKHPVKTSPSIRSAKKRDVRTLSISPTDLGPPPKTQTNNATVRTKQQPVLAQKRTSNNNSQTTTANASPPLTTSKQGSPPPKKVISRRPQVQQAHTKVPLKDHNRLLGHAQQQQQQQQNTSNGPKSGILHNIKGNTTNSSSTTTTAVTPTPPTSGLICEGLKTGNRHSLPQSPQNAGLLHNNSSSNAAHNVVSPSTVVLHQQHQQQGHKQKQHLQIKSSKGAVDFHLVHANKGFEAFGVLVQYLVYDLDAFSCPKVKNDYAQIKQCLNDTQNQLEEVKTTCHDLQDQLQEKDLYYNTRESEIQALHRCELEKAQTSLTELEANAQERIKSLEAELISKDVAHDKKFKDYMQRTELQLIEKDQELGLARDKEQELLKRISALSTTENELREKVQAAEESFAERLLEAAKRERDLADKVNSLSKELELLRNQTCSRERELEDKLHLSHDEIAVLRNSKNFLDHSLSPRKSPVANGNATKMQMLQEVESLRSVLELKQTELSDLRKQNHELKRASDDVPLLHMKISAMESRLEDLQIQLKAKTEEEKELISRNKHLQESYKQELETRSRLSLHNEELQWRLKQNSEKFALALNELSKSYNEQGFLNASKSSLHSSGHGDNLQQQFSGGAENQHQLSSSHNSSLASLNRTNGSDRMIGCFQMDDVSPPSSPIIKGVVEKNDSVSWVLEMDDETPEVLASRMIRRAGSFRSSFNEKSPNSRRQYSLPATTGANPLMQSASATSVMRQNSSESVALMNTSAPAATNSRIRSKSVTIKSSEPKKFTRQNSNGAESRTANGGATLSCNLSSWKDPVCSSSPYTRHERSVSSKHQLVSPTSAPALGFGRRSSFCHDDDDGLYRKPYEAPNLITCDTSALTAAENRLEMRTMPSHPSVQDLKGLKKCHEILESAGEAMVSGTNSEDEGCSASSDDIISSTSSADSATSSLDCNGAGRKHGVLSLEDAIMNKMSTSLSGTPMEVSWSDDVDQFQNGESIV